MITPDQTRTSILYAENHEDSREAISALLTLGGYVVTTARTAAEALDLSGKGGFDLAIVDDWLADGTGAELCKELRKRSTQTQVLIYGSRGDEASIERAFNAGATGYLIKPFVDDLLLAVSDLMGREPGGSAGQVYRQEDRR